MSISGAQYSSFENHPANMQAAACAAKAEETVGEYSARAMLGRLQNTVAGLHRAIDELEGRATFAVVTAPASVDKNGTSTPQPVMSELAFATKCLDESVWHATMRLNQLAANLRENL